MKQQALNIMNCLSYPPFRAHLLYAALHYHMWLVCLYHFFFSSHKRHDFRNKKVLNIKCLFWFSVQLLSETFLILRRIKRNIIINVPRSSCKVPVVFFSDFNDTWSSRHIFEVSPNIKFHKNKSSGSLIVSWGKTYRESKRERQADRWTDGHDQANSRLSQFCDSS
jgi:hypothetical protein